MPGCPTDLLMATRRVHGCWRWAGLCWEVGTMQGFVTWVQNVFSHIYEPKAQNPTHVGSTQRRPCTGSVTWNTSLNHSSLSPFVRWHFVNQPSGWNETKPGKHFTYIKNLVSGSCFPCISVFDSKKVLQKCLLNNNKYVLYCNNCCFQGPTYNN